MLTCAGYFARLRPDSHDAALSVFSQQLASRSDDVGHESADGSGTSAPNAGDGISEHQWKDTVGVIAVPGARFDLETVDIGLTSRLVASHPRVDRDDFVDQPLLERRERSPGVGFGRRVAVRESFAERGERCAALQQLEGRSLELVNGSVKDLPAATPNEQAFGSELLRGRWLAGLQGLPQGADSKLRLEGTHGWVCANVHFAPARRIERTYLG
jgi:hypothetical protein